MTTADLIGKILQLVGGIAIFAAVVGLILFFIDKAPKRGRDVLQLIAFLAPAKTPEPVLRRLATEIRAILAMPDVQAALAERGLDTMNTTPEQFAASHRAEFDVIIRRMKEFGIQAE